MEFLRRNPLIAALGLLCIALAVVVIVEFAVPGASAPGSGARKAAPGEAKLLPSIAAASPDQLYPETTSRPLWIPTRRPAPAAVAAVASFQRGQFVLQGVTIAGETRIALLKEKASGRIHRVEKGRDVNGLQVAEVEAEQVTLAQGGEREVLSLTVQRPGAPGAPAPVAAASGGPFAPAATPGAPPVPGAPPIPVPHAPGTPPSPSPFGAPLVAPTVQPGPLPPGAVQPGAANPSVPAVPQQSTTAPMTPEELLARRRARRNATTPQ